MVGDPEVSQSKLSSRQIANARFEQSPGLETCIALIALIEDDMGG